MIDAVVDTTIETMTGKFTFTLKRKQFHFTAKFSNSKVLKKKIVTDHIDNQLYFSIDDLFLEYYFIFLILTVIVNQRLKKQ